MDGGCVYRVEINLRVNQFVTHLCTRMKFLFLGRKIVNNIDNSLPVGRITAQSHLLYIRGPLDASEVCWGVNVMA